MVALNEVILFEVYNIEHKVVYGSTLIYGVFKTEQILENIDSFKNFS